MQALKWFLIGCLLGLILLLSWKAFVCAFIVSVIAFADWSGKGDGRQWVSRDE